MPKRVHGDGPTPCEFMFVGSQPGWEEEKYGRVFVGKTGDELDRFLDGDRLPSRDDVYLTNIYREFRGKEYVYTTMDLAVDELDLLRELGEVRPCLIVPLGREAARWFLGDVDIDSTQGIAWRLWTCYACAKHGRKVLVTNLENREVLAVGGVYTESGLRNSIISGSALASASSCLYSDKRPDPKRRSNRSHLCDEAVCESGTPKSSVVSRKQSSLQKINALPVGSRVHSREYLHWTSGTPEMSFLSESDRQKTQCSSCGDRLVEIVCFPVVHVAAGFHNPEMAAYVVFGFSQLAAYLEGKFDARTLFDDPFAGKEQYVELTTPQELARTVRGLGSQLAIDTEGWPGRPWSLQFSDRAGGGYLIRATHQDTLAAFGEYLRRNRPRLTYHSALHDLTMMRVLGLPTDLEFDDTMVMAYLLQLEPQGLKALCVRHCGMQMQSYQEILGNAGQRLGVDYLSAIWELEQHDWEQRRQEEFWRLIDAGKRIKVYPKLPKTLLHKAVERGLRSRDIRRWWDNQVEDVRVAAYHLLGDMPAPSLDHVPVPTAIRYGCRDTDGTARVRDQLATRLDTMGLDAVYRLEIGTYPLIERMAHVGLRPDLDHFAALSAQLSEELTRLQGELDVRTGRPGINANSGDQIADYLFDGLGLESLKNTRSGRGSTNDKILEALEHEHPEFPVITTIRDYREFYKLKNTFVDRLPDFVHRWPHDGRVHATFRTTRVVTGRLAASDPNLLAMPKHGKFARAFRRGWVPADGHILCEWDLSQIELRVLAHLSQDPVLLAAFRDGLDLHARLAQRVFGGKEDDHKKGITRLAAKAVNFGIPMGMTCKGLSVELRKNGVEADEDDAQKWLDETNALYKKVPDYQERMAAEARRQGYVRCLSGRIRYIGGIRSAHSHVREEARRFAFSTPIQEGATWIAKQAQLRIWKMLQEYWKQGRWVEALIWVHDAITVETEYDKILMSDLNKHMVAALTEPPQGFTVPILTSGDWGLNWADMDPFE